MMTDTRTNTTDIVKVAAPLQSLVQSLLPFLKSLHWSSFVFSAYLIKTFEASGGVSVGLAGGEPSVGLIVVGPFVGLTVVGPSVGLIVVGSFVGLIVVGPSVGLIVVGPFVGLIVVGPSVGFLCFVCVFCV